MPIIAPSEIPQYDARSTPKSSSSRRTSAARSPMAYGPGGAGDPPCPRCSERSSRKPSPSTSNCGSQTSRVVPIELPSTTTGASRGPSREAASLTGRLAAAAGGPDFASSGVESSDIEEDGLALALQVDIEPEHSGPLRIRLGDQRRPAAGLGDRSQHRVGLVRLGLVGEIDPGHHAVEH